MPNIASSCKRKVCGGEKVKLARTILRSQMPKLASRRRNAGNSRSRRGRQSSHRATVSKLPKSTTKPSCASSRVLVLHHGKLLRNSAPLSERRTHTRRDRLERRREKHLASGSHRIISPDSRNESQSAAVLLSLCVAVLLPAAVLREAGA